MQIGTYKVSETWVALSTLTEETISAGDEVYIQNRGNSEGLLGVLLVCEGAEAPEGDEGDIVMPVQKYTYLAGSDDLYLKSQGGKILINVTKKNVNE